MKVFRWMFFTYFIIGFLVSLYIGERYIFYTTGLFGYTPRHTHKSDEDLKYYDHQGFGGKLCKGGLGGLRWAFWGNFTVQRMVVPIVKGVGAYSTQEELMCEDLFDGFALSVWMSIQERLYDVNYMCSAASLGDDYFYREYDVQDYVDDMTQNLSTTDNSYPTEKPEKLIRMLQISDAHVDRNYLEGSNPDGAAATGGRPHYGMATGDDIPGYWGIVGKGDIPQRTAETGLDELIAQNPDFIIWTGDNLDHYVWYQSYENQFFNQRFLKKYVEDLGYDGPIYPVLGNHEGVPSDMFNFELNLWVFETFADIWKEHLSSEAYRNLSSYGYYHEQHLDTNLRIIGTFSLVYDIQNWQLIPNHTDPLDHLKFLDETLAYGEHNNEVAYIIGHIPPGDVFVLGQWSIRFRAIVNKYKNIIRGQFYGHTHYDEFKNVKSYRDDELSAGIVWATASFTSYPSKQPSLRIWELDPQTWHLWDYEQYRFYIDIANEKVNKIRENPNYTEDELKNTAKWELAYTFRDYFGITMEFEEVAKYIERIKTDKEVAKKIITMMHCEGPDSITRQNEQEWTYCRYANSVFDDHWECNGNTGNMLDYIFQTIQLAHGGSGSWWHKEPTEKYTRQ